MSIIHLSTLIAHKNGLREEEWSNFEFYPDLKIYKFTAVFIHSLSIANEIKPFKNNLTIAEVIELFLP